MRRDALLSAGAVENLVLLGIDSELWDDIASKPRAVAHCTDLEKCLVVDDGKWPLE